MRAEQAGLGAGSSLGGGHPGAQLLPSLGPEQFLFPRSLSPMARGTRPQGTQVGSTETAGPMDVLTPAGGGGNHRPFAETAARAGEGHRAPASSGGQQSHRLGIPCSDPSCSGKGQICSVLPHTLFGPVESPLTPGFMREESNGFWKMGGGWDRGSRGVQIHAGGATPAG